MNDPGGEVSMRILERMLAIRRFEEAVYALRQDGAFTGHYHLYIGQEATGAAAIEALGERDLLFTTHRNHGHLIARGADPGAALAEILGRASGLNGGRGGTFHLADASVGMPHTSALVGGSVPLAAGAAWAAKQSGNCGIGVALFGDGAMEEGVVFETLNIAKLWRLPTIFLCENNSPGAVGRAAGGGNASNLAADSLAGVAAALGVASETVDGADAEAVHRTVAAAADRCRTGDGPAFIEALTERWPGNQGQWPELATGVTDLAMAWDETRIPDGHADWHRRVDPVLRLCRRMIDAGQTTQEALTALDETIRARMADAASLAREAPLPEPDAALGHVFAE